MFFKRVFTLIETMVVVAILVVLVALILPSIRAMQAGNARARAFNIINAALQAARSYAIMHGVNTAARFQPNGKIFIVYRVTPQSATDGINAAGWGQDYTTPANRYPYPNGNQPTDNAILYLPVIDLEPLELPKGYAVSADPPPPNYGFAEPFYICYNSAGTIAVNEGIWAGLTTRDGLPVNPNFNKDTIPVWNPSDFAELGDYSPNTCPYEIWSKFQNNPTSGNDLPDRKLTRFTLVITSPTDMDIAAKLNDADHYGGCVVEKIIGGCGCRCGSPGTPVLVPEPSSSVTRIDLFQTPDHWDELPIYPAGVEQSKWSYVANQVLVHPERSDRIHINPYTGRVIRPVE